MLPTFIGALGMGANIAIYQQKNRIRILIFKLISDMLWALHYFLLGAYSGFAIAVIGMVRECIFIIEEKRGIKSKPWLFLFLAISILSAVLTWKNAFSLLPACASILSIIGFWQSKPRLTRMISFPVSACMLTYDIVSGSIVGVCNEAFTLISAAVGVIRYRSSRIGKSK